MPKHDKTYGRVDEFEFRGEKFEISVDALKSVRVQRDIARAQKASDFEALLDAIDKVCCGHVDEYQDRIHEEDGSIGTFGATYDAFLEFISAVGEAYAPKN